MDEGRAMLAAEGARLQPLLTWLQSRQEFLIHLEAGNRQGAKQIIQRQGGLGSNLSPWVPRSQLLAQQAADLKAVSPEDAMKDSREQLQKVIEISRQVLAAEDPKAIDPLVEQLTNFQRVDYSESRGEEGQRVQEAATSARQFARRWQDFLIARAAGDREAARQILAQLTTDGRDYPGVPRAEMLAKAYGEKAQAGDGKSGAGSQLLSAQQIMAQITDLEALDRLLPELQSASRTMNSYEQQSSISLLQEIARAYREFNAGNATRVNLNLSGVGSGDGPVNKLRNDLALLVLPSLIGVEKPDHPKADETPLTYLRRMLNTARERKDWLLAQRILSTAQNTGVNDPLIRSADSSAITQFISGVTLEKGKQYALAVNAYQLALKAGSELIPAEDIGSRLEAIEKSHPEAYKEGSELTMAPPVSRSGYPPGMRSPYPPGFPPPQPTAPRGEQSVVVPARPEKAPAAAPAPAPAALVDKPAEKAAEPKPAPAP